MMMSNLKNKIRYYEIVVYNKIILTRSYSLLRNFLMRHKYDAVPANYEKVLQKVREKASRGEKINVAFYILETNKWKYEGIYRLLEKDARFNPYIVVVPYAAGAIIQDDFAPHMLQVYRYFKDRGYNVFLPYSEKDNRVLTRADAPELNPDILFHMNCWHEYGRFVDFGYERNMDCLQAYVPYAWMISNRYIEHFNRDFHNKLWTIFYETPLHVKMAMDHAINKGVNAVASGYPLLDEFFFPKKTPVDVWKPQEKKKKRIIWAPHHHMLEKNRCANFLDICDVMVEMAKKYADQIQFVFKPHPELAKKLDTAIPGWNRERREAYYKLWETMPNTQVCLDEYVDLFLTSDAMIQDCGSFTAEYTCTYKPMLFLIANPGVVRDWNECGKAILENIYTSEKGAEIENFIKHVVIDGEDSMKEKRTAFIDRYLRPQNPQGASMAIYEYLLKKLDLSEKKESV